MLHHAEKFEKAAKARLAVHTYPSRKRSFSKTLALIGRICVDRKHFKGARSRYFRSFCLILEIRSSKRQIGGARVFHLQNQG